MGFAKAKREEPSSWSVAHRATVCAQCFNCNMLWSTHALCVCSFNFRHVNNTVTYFVKRRPVLL